MRRHPLWTATVGGCSLHDQQIKTRSRLADTILSRYKHNCYIFTSNKYFNTTRGTKRKQAINYTKYLNKCSKLSNDAQWVTIRTIRHKRREIKLKKVMPRWGNGQKEWIPPEMEAHSQRERKRKRRQRQQRDKHKQDWLRYHDTTTQERAGQDS